MLKIVGTKVSSVPSYQFSFISQIYFFLLDIASVTLAFPTSFSHLLKLFLIFINLQSLLLQMTIFACQ